MTSFETEIIIITWANIMCTVTKLRNDINNDTHNSFKNIYIIEVANICTVPLIIK